VPSSARTTGQRAPCSKRTRIRPPLFGSILACGVVYCFSRQAVLLEQAEEPQLQRGADTALEVVSKLPCVSRSWATDHVILSGELCGRWGRVYRARQFPHLLRIIGVVDPHEQQELVTVAERCPIEALVEGLNSEETAPI
jgi:hypothetical protein